MVYRTGFYGDLESFVELVNSGEFSPSSSSQQNDFTSVQDYPDYVLVEAADYDDDWQVRQAACLALSQRSGRTVEETLLARLHDEDSDVVRAALVALRGRSEPKIFSAIVEAIQSAELEEDALVEAVAIIAVSNHPGVAEALCRVLTLVGEPTAGQLALEAMAADTCVKTTSALAKVLPEIEDWELRRETVNVLAGRRCPEVSAALLKLVHDDDDIDVRQAAFEAAICFNDLAVTAQLLDAALAEQDFDQGEGILDQLEPYRSPESTLLLGKFLEWEDSELVERAVKIIAECNDEHVKPLLMKATLYDDCDVAEAAIEGLARFNSPQTIDALVELMRTAELYENQQTSLAKAIAGYRDDAATVALAELVGRWSDNYEAVEVAAEALGERTTTLQRLYRQLREQGR